MYNRGAPRPAYQNFRPYAGGPASPAAAAQGHKQNPFLDQLGLQNKYSFGQVKRAGFEAAQRHVKRQVPADLIGMTCNYAEKSRDELAIPRNVNIDFQLKDTPTHDRPEEVATVPHEENGVKTRYFVKVMLFSGVLEKEETAKLHLTKKMKFLLAQKMPGGYVPVGGEWSAAADGKTPNDAALKKTAIRCAKEMLNLDLSACQHWFKFVEFDYLRADGDRSHTVVFLPNIWDHFADGMQPSSQTKEESKEVVEEVEEEEEDKDDSTKKTKVKKKVTTVKKLKTVVVRPMELTLGTMLDQETRSGTEDTLELYMFADCFDEMLQRDHGLDLIELLKVKKAEYDVLEKERKRKREELEVELAAKKKKLEEEAKVRAEEAKAKAEEAKAKAEARKTMTTEELEAEKEALKKEAAEKEEARKEAAKEAAAKLAAAKEEAAKKPKMKIQHTVNQEMLPPFQYFDRAMAGAVRREVLEGMLHQLGTFTRQQVDDLLAAVNLKKPLNRYQAASVLYYIKLATTTTEVEVVEEKKEEKKEEEKKEEKKAETANAASPAKPAENGKDAMDEDAEEAGAASGETASADLTEESLSKLLLKDLRTMCTEKGLNATGKKADLITRLVSGKDEA
eukprot:NODE_67_length_2142_cov_685.308648_g52_i0.p1 GENE.NODE_67_length_2142_cov_685.308648_g52_i0~~NODE_67_length_2142_cov_685.308648_g52_i0.p1  ORF type:complete len:647 (+),score=375.53 NODE_67_length_2142_cov_685.308648_g52_i0:81-1943(+)